MRNRALEEALRRAPDDVAPYLVYADWLQERGDARGALITVQCALETAADSGDRVALVRQERKLLREHHDKFHGPLSTQDVSWFRGFWSQASIRLTAGTSHGKAVGHPSSAALRRLAVRFQPRRKLGGLWKELPCLEQLELRGQLPELGELHLPALEQFRFYTSGITERMVRTLGTGTFPRLKELRLVQDIPLVSEVDAAAFEPLFAGEGLPELTSLAITGHGRVDRLLEGLADGALLSRLAHLDLSDGVGGNAVLDVWRRFSHLETLVLPTGCDRRRIRDKLPGAEFDA